ncbi:MAG: lipopolysaccharide heptosyltransferase II [Planctomycetes bacterium]|nr:lipopolysaccharide heptosyltransferase II [Planctomycetota bacterium]
MNPTLAPADRILVRCPNWVGDLVMATPTFDCLRASFPHARIAAVVRRYARGVIEGGPWFDEVIDCDDKSAAGFTQTVRRLRAFGADAAVLLPNSLRSLLTVRLAGIGRVYGYRRGFRGLLLSDGPAPLRDGRTIRPVPMMRYYLDICRWLGLPVPEDPRPRLYVGEEAERFARAALARYGVGPDDVVVGLNPGAKFGSSKCWPVEHFARLAERLQESLGCKILLFAGPGEDVLADRIVRAGRARLINTGPDRVDLARLKPLVRRCNLLVTNDTGPRHYAVAFDVPTVVIMGPTDPRYTDANLERTVVIRKDLDCSPCHKKTCPTDHRCMTAITPEEVFEACERMLSGQRTAL